MRNLVVNGISVIIVTKVENDDAAILRDYGIQISVRPDINFDCCIIDKFRIWYGSVNILGFHSTEDNVITFQDAETSNHLIDILIKLQKICIRVLSFLPVDGTTFFNS